jgi:membrane carboxypeptidase/penicillin-binding protein
MNFLDSLLALVLRSVATLIYPKQADEALRRIDMAASLLPCPTKTSTVITALVQAEDHRFFEHKGIDSRAIVRAIVVTVFTRRTEGASTITQQLVRVVSQDYRRTIGRKWKELCLAAWIDARVTKKQQAVAYLQVAYFGWQMNGLAQAAKRLNVFFPCSEIEAAAIVARLKYPEPKLGSPKRKAQIASRQLHILKRMRNTHE